MSTDRKATYDAYLLSQHWADLRERALNAANRKCESCRSTFHLVGHHVLYREPLESCTVEDIMCLCDRCHNHWHRWLKSQGKHTHDFTRETTIAQMRTLIGQGFMGKTCRKKVRKALKAAGIRFPKNPKPQRNGKYEAPSVQSILERTVFEYGKQLLEMKLRVEQLERKLSIA